MSYLVLARKFRPQSFTGLVGQDHISKALANAIVRGRVPHALLFTGPRGVGKTSSARVLARALNCTGRPLPDPETSETELREKIEPCGHCVNCQEIAKSSSMAVWEIDGASNNSVDNVRDLIDSLRSAPPPGSEYKIYIIDEVHMLSVAAFNALLKSLEEPPPNTIFIFATTEPHKIPETVISRCQRHDFRRIGEEAIAEHLRSIAAQEGVAVEDEVYGFVARRAQGGMRDAQSMFDRLISFADGTVTLSSAQQVFGVLDHSFFVELSERVFAADVQACLGLLARAFTHSLDVRTFLGDFLEHWRNVLLLSCGAPAGEGDASRVFDAVLRLSLAERKTLLQQLAGKEAFDVQRLFDIAEDTVMRAQQSSYPRYSIEAGLIKMAMLPSLRPLPEILESLRGVGSGMSGGVSPSASSARAAGSGASSGKSVAPAFVAANPKDAKGAKSVAAENQATAKSQLATVPSPTAQDANEPAKVEVAVVAEAGVVDFNPSWQAFVAHVRSRRMPVLEALLKRVSPTQFVSGTLLASAAAFDRNQLLDAETNKALRDCLHSYSGSSSWEVRIELISETSNQHLPGSVAAEEAHKNQQSKLKIEREARSDPAVTSVLEAFSGSKIERIALLRD